MTGWSPPRVPYPGVAFPRTHPEHLAVMARIAGHDAPDPVGARVLELACGDGLNLVAMAVADPSLRATGIDLDPEAIGRGRAVVDELGLDHVDLRVADLADPATREGLGPAAFVVAHGIWSWSPEAVRDAVLATIAARLTPDGVAMLSFMVAPGAAVRQALGRVVGRAAGGDPDHGRALAAALLPWSTGRVEPYAGVLNEQLERLSGERDAMLVHDDFEPWVSSDPHGDVVAHAARHGLRVLTETDTGRLCADHRPDGLAEQLAGLAGDPVAEQELEDALTGRTYRELVLVRDDAPRVDPVEAVLRGLRIGPDRTPVREAAERAGTDPRADAAELLAGLADGSVVGDHVGPSFEGPPEGARTLHGAPARHTLEITERPRASPLAVLQAERGDASLTTLRHEMVSVRDAAGLALIAHADGTRTHDRIVADVAAALARDGVGAEDDLRRRLDERMSSSLALIASLGLLQRDSATAFTSA